MVPEEQTAEEALESETLAASLRGDVLGGLSEQSSQRFAAELLTALGHSTRLRIVDLLRRHAMTVGQISGTLGVSQANASQHLGVLLRAGAVARTSDGATRRYSLRGDKIGVVIDVIEEFRQAHLQEMSG